MARRAIAIDYIPSGRLYEMARTQRSPDTCRAPTAPPGKNAQ